MLFARRFRCYAHVRRADRRLCNRRGMTEQRTMSKPSRSFARPLRDVAGKIIGKTFTRQGFASAELVTRWPDIVGAEIAAHCEPIKMQWMRPMSASRSSPSGGDTSESAQTPATLVLRVEGPAAIEIQHLANVICDRVNGFFGWRAVARIGLRQAPLRHGVRRAPRRPDPVATARVAANLTEIDDAELRQALARLGAAIKRP
jgi:hypothetical protein